MLFLLLALFAGCEYNNLDNNNSPVIERERLYGQEHIMSMPYEELSENEILALGMAIDDEYKARATYYSVIEKFGEVRPFISIVESEENHIERLIELYNKYNLEIPEDNWKGYQVEYGTLKEACIGGVNAELDNVELYEYLFEIIENEDISTVFKSLRDASFYNHLPAFERCAR